jgi:hypothetical protein
VLASAERALGEGRIKAALVELLEVWRTTRAPALAQLIELVSLPVTAAALPGVVDYERYPTMYAYYPWRIHPWRMLRAPDPRTTAPIVLSANHVFELASEHEPRWPDTLDEQLISHGDPRALEVLARMCGDRFADRRARLARALPPPSSSADDDAIIGRMLQSVRDAPARLRTALARATSPCKRQQLIALGLAHWLPTLSWHVLAPVFDDSGACTRCTLPPIPEAIRAVTGTAEWSGVRELHLYGDRFSASERHPWLAPQLVHRGGEVQRALVALLSDRHVAPRTVTGISTDLARALAAAGARVAWTDVQAWHDARLLDALIALDPPATALSLSALDRAELADPAALAPLWPTPLGARLRALSVDVAFDRWHAWLAPGAMPDHLERLELRPGGRTYVGTATRDGPGWMLALALPEHWIRWDAEFEQPPTPGADLTRLLGRLDPSALTGLIVDSLAEIEDEAPRATLVQAARGQRDLTRLVVPLLEGCESHDELDTCSFCHAPPRP